MELNPSDVKSIFQQHTPFKDKFLEQDSKLFNTLQGEKYTPPQSHQQRNLSPMEHTDRFRNKKDLRIERVVEENEGEGETQQIIESDPYILKQSQFVKRKPRQLSAIGSSRNQEIADALNLGGTIFSPQLKLNNGIEFPESQQKKNSLRKERLQELKRIMMKASHKQHSTSSKSNKRSTRKNRNNKKNQKDYQNYQEEDEEDQQRDAQAMVDSQSIQSSQSDHFIKKTVFLDLIESKKPPQVIRAIDYFGKISIVCMVLVALLSFAILKSQYESEIQLYSEQTYCDNLFTSFVSLMSYYNFGRICTLKSDWSLAQTDRCQNNVEFDLEFQGKLNQIRDVLLYLENNNINSGLQNMLLNKQINLTIDSSDLYETALADISGKSFEYLLNSLLQFFYALKREGSQDRPAGYDRFFYLNMKYFLTILQEFSDTSFEDVQTLLASIESTSRTTLIILILTIFIIISMAVPMFVRVQYSRQTILQLFGTTSFNKLVETQRAILETIIEILPLYYDFTKNTILYVKKSQLVDDLSQSLIYRDERDRKLNEINNFRIYLEKLLLDCQPLLAEKKPEPNKGKLIQQNKGGQQEQQPNYTIQLTTDNQQTDVYSLATEGQQLKQQQSKLQYPQLNVYNENQIQRIEEDKLRLPETQMNHSFQNLQQFQEVDTYISPQQNLVLNPVLLNAPPPSTQNQAAVINHVSKSHSILYLEMPSPTKTLYPGTRLEQAGNIQSNEQIQTHRYQIRGQRVSLESSALKHKFRNALDMSSSIQDTESTRKRIEIIQQQKKQNFLFHQIISHLNLQKDSGLPHQEQQKSDKQTEIYNGSSENIKKRNISQTSLLQKLNMSLIVKVTLIFCITSAFPAMNYIVSENFINQINRNVNVLQLLTLSKFSILNQLFYQTSKWKFILIGENLDLLPQYQQEITSLQSINMNQIQQLYSIQNIMGERDKTTYTTVDFQSLDALFYTVQQDACPILQQYYVNLNETQYYQQCVTTFQNGIFQDGLIIGVQSIMTTFASFIQGDEQITTQQQMSNMLLSYDQNYNLMSFFDIISVANTIYFQLRDFLIFYTNNFYSNQTGLQNILILAYAMIALVIGLTLFWMRFIKKTSQSLINTKNLLGIFSIQLLIENRYIYSFLNRQAKSNKT